MMPKLFFLMSFVLGSSMASMPGDVWQLEINGPIGPATSDYIVRSMEDAQNSAAEVIILRMDTPGGLDQAMREIIQTILASRVPVVGYVGPRAVVQPVQAHTFSTPAILRRWRLRPIWEHQAATKLTEAATILAGEEQAIQLRYLQTLNQIAGENNSTIVFPFPVDFLNQFFKEKKKR